MFQAAATIAPTNPYAEQPGLDRRRFRRVRLVLLGRYMLSDRREFPCQTIDISAGGIALYAPVQGELGERVVIYLDHLGRLEGEIVRTIENGFAVRFTCSQSKRDKNADVLTWLINREALGIPDERRHERYVPRNNVIKLFFADAEPLEVVVIDISQSGAALSMSNKLPVGTRLRVGKTEATVVRHIQGGIAVEFSEPQTRFELVRTFGEFDF